MMNESILTLEFAANSGNVSIARAALQGISAEYFGSDRGRADDISIAATEAMNNAVEHSGTATVKVEVGCNENELRVSVSSDGPRFDPTTVAAGLSEESMLERDEGGYGLYLIRELVDGFEYEYRDSRNIWLLRKFI